MIPYIIERSQVESAFHIPSGFCYLLVRVLPNVDLVGQVSKLFLSEVFKHDESSVSMLQSRRVPGRNEADSTEGL